MKNIALLPSLVVLSEVVPHASPKPIKTSLRRTESSNGPNSTNALRPNYNSTNSSPQPWCIDWNDVKCVELCEDGGPPPCSQTQPASWAYEYSSEEECCTELFGSRPPAGRCVEPTARAAVENLIEESERELIPKFLRLGFHDCVGGCDGCVDLSNPDHKGLLEPIEAIADIVDRFKEWYSRADIWALATLVSAEQSLNGTGPEDVTFPLRYIGRQDCEGADEIGRGGPNITMPKNSLTTHELLDFFSNEFDFTADETVAIMGAHAVAVATRDNVGFGNIDKEEGWVFEAEEYILDNRYYSMLLGDDQEDPMWELELVHNNETIPSRYQWFHEKEGEEERPIMTNADMALVRDFSEHISVDEDGNVGKVECVFKDINEEEELVRRRLKRERRKRVKKQKNARKPVVCPVASETIGKALEYKMDNELFLYDFEAVLEKMVNHVVTV